MVIDLIFIDSNILVSYYNAEDQNHELAKNVIADIEQNKYGSAIISDYVFDEIITVTLTRIKDKEIVIKLGIHILRSEIKILKVNKKIFQRAWQLFKESDLKMSFTDFTNLAFLEIFDIKYLATFDREFKKIREVNIIDK